MNIILDMDEVIVSFMQPLLDKYNEKHQSNVNMESITSWELPPGMTQIFNEQGFFVSLPPLPGAIEGVRKLVEGGHDVIIATSPSRNGHIAKEKMTWIDIWLPEMMENLHIVHRKDRLVGDVLCDDRPKFLTDFPGWTIMMDKPWNRDAHIHKCIRVEGFAELMVVLEAMPMIKDAAQHIDVARLFPEGY